jgi:hypothetical protein
MPSSKSAETNFREAFERLKAGVPKVLPPGTMVSQNNVAKEAGCDPTALKKARFPGLVSEIQAYLAAHTQDRPRSERQRQLKARQVSRDKSQTIENLRAQRDDAASRLVEAREVIIEQAARIRDLEVKLEDLQPSAAVTPIPTSSRPKATPGPWT